MDSISYNGRIVLDFVLDYTGRGVMRILLMEGNV